MPQRFGVRKVTIRRFYTVTCDNDADCFHVLPGKSDGLRLRACRIALTCLSTSICSRDSKLLQRSRVYRHAGEFREQSRVSTRKLCSRYIRFASYLRLNKSTWLVYCDWSLDISHQSEKHIDKHPPGVHDQIKEHSFMVSKTGRIDATALSHHGSS